MRPRTRWKRLVRWVTALWRGNPRGWDDCGPEVPTELRILTQRMPAGARTLEQFNQGERR